MLGPVLSVFAVLAVTAPATWLTLRTDHGSKLADALPDHSISTRSDDAGAASRGRARPSDTTPSNKSGLPGRTHRSRTTPAPSTPASTAPTSPVSTLKPTTVPPPKPTTRPTTTKPRPTTPPPSTTKPPATTAPPSGDSPSAYEAEVVRLTNNERAKAGCGALTIDSALMKSSGGHAEDMVARHFFDHTNPDGKDPFERMGDAGFHGSAMAENIAMGYADPQAAVTGWMNSSGHKRNILNCGYNRIGVGYDPGQVLDGYSKGSWVQNFGTK